MTGHEAAPSTHDKTTSKGFTLVDLTLDECKRFVADHHRHSRPSTIWRFGVGLELDGRLVGVAMAGNPKGPWSTRGMIEILRCCTDGTRNACTKLYGAICQAARALGYRHAVTYTLASEGGASLRAAGFEVLAQRPARGYGGGRPRYEANLFGEPQRPEEAKSLWWRPLVKGAVLDVA